MREIIVYGSSGNFVVAIQSSLYFFGLSGTAWYQLAAKESASSGKIEMLAYVTDSIVVTGDDKYEGYLKTCDISDLGYITELRSTST